VVFVLPVLDSMTTVDFDPRDDISGAALYEVVVDVAPFVKHVGLLSPYPQTAQASTSVAKFVAAQHVQQQLPGAVFIFHKKRRHN